MIWWLLLLSGVGAAQQQHSCAPCHTEQLADFKTHRHSSKAGMDCGACHGPSEKHRKSNGESAPDRVAAPDEVARLCGNCHLNEKTQYEQTRHSAALIARTAKAPNCNTCHGHHAQKEWAATEAGCKTCHTSTPSLCKEKPLAGLPTKVSCMNCHGRHTLVVAGR